MQNLKLTTDNLQFGNCLAVWREMGMSAFATPARMLGNKRFRLLRHSREGGNPEDAFRRVCCPAGFPPSRE